VATGDASRRPGGDASAAAVRDASPRGLRDESADVEPDVSHPATVKRDAELKAAAPTVS
jgi:hypothetical protein